MMSFIFSFLIILGGFRHLGVPEAILTEVGIRWFVVGEIG